MFFKYIFIFWKFSSPRWCFAGSTHGVGEVSQAVFQKCWQQIETLQGKTTAGFHFYFCCITSPSLGQIVFSGESFFFFFSGVGLLNPGTLFFCFFFKFAWFTFKSLICLQLKQRQQLFPNNTWPRALSLFLYKKFVWMNNYNTIFQFHPLLVCFWLSDTWFYALRMHLIY